MYITTSPAWGTAMPTAWKKVYHWGDKLVGGGDTLLHQVTQTLVTTPFDITVYGFSLGCIEEQDI